MKNNLSIINNQSSTINPLRVVFFGTPHFVDSVLEKLQENFDVVKIVRSPQQWSDEAIIQLHNLNPDLFVVAAYGQILPKKLLDIPLLGTLNIHPSLLPKYRGPSPVQTAILNGETKTGITIIKLDEQVDHGPILFQKELEIKPNDTSETLLQKVFIEGAKNLVKNIEAYAKNEIKLYPQDDSKATFTKILTREDGFLNLETLKIGNLKFKDSLEIRNWKLEIARRIRAYYPWPGVWTRFEIVNNKSSIIKFLPQQKIQVEGKKPMSYKDFMNGYPDGKVFLQKLSLI